MGTMITPRDLQQANERTINFRLQTVTNFEQDHAFELTDIFGLDRMPSKDITGKILVTRARLWQELIRVGGDEISHIENSFRLAAFSLYGHQIFSEKRRESGFADVKNMIEAIFDGQEIPEWLRAYFLVAEHRKRLREIVSECQGNPSKKPPSFLALMARIEQEKLKETNGIQNPSSVAALTALFIQNDITRILRGRGLQGSIDAHANQRVRDWVEAPVLQKYPRELRGGNGALRKSFFPIAKFETVYRPYDVKAMLDIPTLVPEGIETTRELVVIMDDILTQIIGMLDEPVDIEDAVLLRRALEYGFIAHIFEEEAQGSKSPESIIDAVRQKVLECMSRTHIEATREKIERKKEQEQQKLQAGKEKWRKFKDVCLNIITLGLHSLIPVGGKNVIWKIIFAGLVLAGIKLPQRED